MVTLWLPKTVKLPRPNESAKTEVGARQNSQIKVNLKVRANPASQGIQIANYPKNKAAIK